MNAYSIALVAMLALPGTNALWAQSESIGPMSASGQIPSLATKGGGESLRGNLNRPLFIENRGQWNRRAKFLLRSPGLDLWITGNGMVYELNRVEPAASSMRPRAVAANERPTNGLAAMVRSRSESAEVHVSFVGASGHAAAAGIDRIAGYHNYFLGNDRSTWAHRVPLFGGVNVRDIYPGIDAVYYLDGAAPRYDLVVGAGVDPTVIRMSVAGATSIRVSSSGSLLIGTPLGDIEQKGLVAYQQKDGRKQAVRCRFIADMGFVRFELGRYDHTRALIIDPIVYASPVAVIGDQSLAVDVDDDNCAYVTGTTFSTELPTLNAAQPSRGGGTSDCFVTKLNADGSLAYSTYLGGSDLDDGFAIAGGSTGGAVVYGHTASTDFPLVNATQTAFGGGPKDGFVTMLTSDGALAYSTFLGGSGDESLMWGGVALDADGNATVAGTTSSSNFPILNASQATYGGGPSDCFITRLTAAGAISHSTFLGGAGDDLGMGVAVAADGSVAVTGWTTSLAFPLLHPSQNIRAGYSDAFVARFSGSGARIFSTYLGGGDVETCNDIDIDPDGNIYVTGSTSSMNFPTLNAAQPALASGFDAFVTKFSSAGSRLYSTFLGGIEDDIAYGIAADNAGCVYVTGETYVWGEPENYFPTLKALQPNYGGGLTDGFVVRLTATGSLSYSTYLGQGEGDILYDVAIDEGGNAYVTGTAGSPDFPDLSPDNYSSVVVKLSRPERIDVVSPTAGTALCSGSSFTIVWSSDFVNDVRIELSSDGGASWEVVSAGTPATDGQFIWSLPDAIVGGHDYVVRISDLLDATVNGTSQGEFTVLNAPPTIIAPAALELVADDGSCYRDASHVDLGAPTVSDDCTQLDDIALINDAPASFPPGVTIVTWTATDGAGNTRSALQLVTIIDAQAPALTVTLSQSILWPANNQMRTIGITAGLSDNCDGGRWELTSVVGDDGATGIDIAAATGTAATSFDVRAKRTGSGGGRTYTALFTATDAAGNVVTRSATVVVPHHQGLKPSMGLVPEMTSTSSMLPSPNPFTEYTEIAIPSEGPDVVKVDVIDPSGLAIRHLGDVVRHSGHQFVRWDGTTEEGARVPSGLYLLRIELGGQSIVRSVLLVR
jgi:hypothetical protein